MNQTMYSADQAWHIGEGLVQDYFFLDKQY